MALLRSYCGPQFVLIVCFLIFQPSTGLSVTEVDSNIPVRGVAASTVKGHVAADCGSPSSNLSNGSGFSDDDDDDVTCRDFHNMPNLTDICAFVNSTPDCQIDEGFINYITFVYCTFQEYYAWGLVIIFVWLIFLFVGLAVTADDFFCPALAVISDTLHLSHNIAGVTFLAFGNGAPDVFSALASIQNAKGGDASLAVGALFGAGVFVTTVIPGAITVIQPFKAMERPFLRDVVFYLGASFWAFYVLWDRVITKLEAIGFLLLYAGYVAVVIVGRAIYQKWRRREEQAEDEDAVPTSQNDSSPAPQTASVNSTPVILNEDAAERAPLLSSNSLVESESIVTIETVELGGHGTISCLNPIDTESWSGRRFYGKIYEIFKAPVVFLLKLTVPVVDYEQPLCNWNRYLQTLQCVTGPVFSIFATKVGLEEVGMGFPVWAIVLILSSVLSLVVFATTKNDKKPRFHSGFAYLSFVVAVVWIYSIANEIVNILQAFGIALNISNAILGLTLLAWGNSIGDFIADTAMARQGYPRMGISACFGGLLFNVLLGMGLPFLIRTAKYGDFKLLLTLEEVVLAGFLGFSLLSSLIIVPLSGFKMTRIYGIYLIIVYITFLIVAILVETGAIPTDLSVFDG